MVMNDMLAPSPMTCGLYIGIGEELSSGVGTPISNVSTSINIHVVDLLAEVSITCKYNSRDLPITPTYVL
jgi:hypothetical protein